MGKSEVPYKSYLLPVISVPSIFAQCNLLITVLIISSLSSSLGIDKNIGIEFTEVPESRVAPPGDWVFFPCKSNIGRGQKIKWLHNGVLLNPDNRRYIKINNGQLSIKLRKSRRHVDQQKGRYECVAGVDNMFLMSLPAQLDIAHLDKFPRADDVNVVEANVGNNVILACTPPSSVPQAVVQWYKDGQPVNISQEERQSLVNLQHLLIENLILEQSGQYVCHASNHLTNETVISNQAVNLTVLPEEDLHKPRLLMEPRSEYHPIAGENISIPCSASGAPRPTITWEHDAFNSQPMIVDQQGPREILQLNNVNLNSSGQYTCKIWNSRGRKILRKTLVYVAEKPSASISSFTHDPHLEGDPLELYCEVKGFPIPEVYWVVNGKRKYRHKKHQWEENKLSESGKLLIRELSLEDAGIYQCFAENEVGVVYDAVKVRVVPTMRNSSDSLEDEDDYHHKRSRNRGSHNDLVPPSAPNVTQVWKDSVIVTWSMPEVPGQEVEFFKVQYRDLGEVNKRDKSDWRTLDGVIDKDIRSYEVPGLLVNHAYRFRIGVVIKNEGDVHSKVSKRFRIEANTQQAPTVIPHLMDILPLGETSLSVRWSLPENSSASDNIEGYFLNFKLSELAGLHNYNQITLPHGPETHSHIIDNLQPGKYYDIKVRAFNYNGAGPFSQVRAAKTNGKPTDSMSKSKMEKEKALPSKNEPKLKDTEARQYLIIGVSLGCVCLLLFSLCVGATLWRRHQVAAKFSSTNASIHNKYQDTSLQINTSLQYGDTSVYDHQDQRHQDHGGDNSTDSQAVHETSFTDYSYEQGLDQYSHSQGSTAFIQVTYYHLSTT